MRKPTKTTKISNRSLASGGPMTERAKPPTLDYVPRKGWGGVFWLKHRDFIARDWDGFAERFEAAHGRTLAPGERRMLVLNVRIGDTHESAIASARPGHDEFWKFLGPYGWSRGYRSSDGTPVAAGLIPTLEDSMEQGTWIVGTAEEVAAQISAYRTRLDLADLTLFPCFPGDSYTYVEEQMQRYAESVRPLL